MYCAFSLNDLINQKDILIDILFPQKNMYLHYLEQHYCYM